MVAVPRKLVAGMKTTLVPKFIAVPLVGATAIILSVPPGVSTTSFSRGIKLPVVFSVMEFVNGLANGGMLVTVIVMSELFVPPTLSVMA
jgi:hypothetical protein